MNDLLTREATEAEIAQLTKINELTRPFQDVSSERDPWTVTLQDGMPVILYFPLKAAVALENLGYAIRAASAGDLAENFARSQQPWTEWAVIECGQCTRHDRCDNHEQHAVGCHCLYRGPFFYVYQPDGTREIACISHRTVAANTVEIEFI